MQLLRRKDFNNPVQFLEQENSIRLSLSQSNHISTKAYSLSSVSKVERVSIFETDLALEDISGFVVCMCVGSAVKVNFLYPQGPSQSFRFPATPDILTVPAENILMKIDPKCTRGAYTLPRKESRNAGEKLGLKLIESEVLQ